MKKPQKRGAASSGKVGSARAAASPPSAVSPATAEARSVLCLQAVTFLHPGSGQSGGFIDLPLQREVHTGLPMIAGGGVKGALRAHLEDLNKKGKSAAPSEGDIKAIFGAETGDEGAGAIAFTDARLLALPVRSMNRVFLWVSCPMVLKRLDRDLRLCGHLAATAGPLVPPAASTTVVEGEYFGPGSDRLVLEEFAFQRATGVNATRVNAIGAQLAALAADNFDTSAWAMISDEEFTYLCEHATQVMARNRLGKNKTTNTADDGNFWYEETLPPETLMYALLFAEEQRISMTPQKDAPALHTTLWDALDAHSFVQFGGNETVGQGWCKVKRYPEGAS